MARVLLVDDEEALRLMMGRQLRRAGHEVVQAEDGLAAVEILQRESFDVVCSDMKMPRLDGMGLLARATEIAPDTEFVILTGHGNMENAVEAFKTGNVFDYLLKPLNDIHELDAVVARAVERRHLRRENTRLVRELEERIQELETTHQQLADMAERDGLTGLLNHRAIHRRLNEILKTHPDAPLTVMVMDMDGFKLMNDTFGHPVGDRALKHLAAALVACCGEKAALGRYGGDEFMAVLPGLNAPEAGQVAEQVRQWMDAHPFISPENLAIPLPLCFGLADVTTAGASSIGLVAAADAALYNGKRSGGDTVTLHMVSTEDTDATLERNSFDVLEALVTAIDKKDRYTRAHSEDMTAYALQLVSALGCSDETYNIVRVAGLLHDVGKIGVPDSILKKPGKLTEAEYELMKGHVTLSALIIHGLPHLSDVLDAVANHHERWDGKGYPQGLAGENIPLLGRIMAVADAFSAMTMTRPYRSGLTLEAALVEVEKGAGTQFDPALASLFIQTMRAHTDAPMLRAA